jgi:hypothetical protein
MVLRLKTRESRSLPGLPNATLSHSLQGDRKIARPAQSQNDGPPSSGPFALTPKTEYFAKEQDIRGLLLAQKPEMARGGAAR